VLTRPKEQTLPPPMIYIVCMTSILVYLTLRPWKNDMELQGQTQKFSFLLIKSVLEFSRCFIPVTLFYVALSIFFSGSDETTIRVLRTYEADLHTLKDFLSHLKLTPTVSFVALLLAFALTLVANRVEMLRLHKQRVERLHALLRKYHKWVGKVTLVVTLLGSFTFFGQTVASQQIGHLEATIKDLRQKCEQFRTALEDEIRFRTATQTMKQLPSVSPSFRPALDACEKVDREQQELTKDRKASAEYKIKSPKLDLLLADYDNRQTKVNTVVTEPDVRTRLDTTAVRAYESSLSSAKIEKLEALLAEYRLESAQQIKAAFETPLGSQVGSTILKMILSERYLPGVKALTDAFPIAGPLLSVLSDSARTKASNLIADATDRIARAAIAERAPTLAEGIEHEASKVAAAVVQNVSEPGPAIIADTISAAQSNANRIRDIHAEFQTLLKEKKEKISNENKVLAQRLAARRRMTDRYQNASQPVREAMIRFENAVDGLVEDGKKRDDPLKQKEFLEATDRAIAQRDFFRKLSDLAVLAHEDFVDPGISETFQELERNAEQSRQRERNLIERERERIRVEHPRIL
jgi:hypothetical protein